MSEREASLHSAPLHVLPEPELPTRASSRGQSWEQRPARSGHLGWPDLQGVPGLSPRSQGTEVSGRWGQEPLQWGRPGTLLSPHY